MENCEDTAPSSGCCAAMREAEVASACLCTQESDAFRKTSVSQGLQPRSAAQSLDCPAPVPAESLGHWLLDTQ